MVGYFLGVLIITAGAFLVIILPKRIQGWFAAFTVLGAAYPIIHTLIDYYKGTQSLFLQVRFPWPIGNAEFMLDPLSAFFSGFITILSIIIVFYSQSYMRSYYRTKSPSTSYNFFLLLLCASMLVLVTVQSAFIFLLVWEIMALSGFFLILFEGEKKEVRSAAMSYLVWMHIALMFLTAGFLLVSMKTGTFSFSDFRTAFQVSKGFANGLFVLFFIGFGIKSGFFPFHSWLPEVHSAAPAPVSAIMSAMVIQIGIYGILRLLILIQAPTLLVSYSMLAISCITAVWGIINALVKKDLYTTLAFSSVQNTGMIGIGIGLGMLGISYQNTLLTLFGFSGALLQLINHSLFKSLLFFSAGNVYLASHTTYIDNLGGLGSRMPVTTLFFLIGSLALCGFPPLNGFVGQFIIYSGLLSGMQAVVPATPWLKIASILSFTVLAAAGSLALFAFTKAFGIGFLGNPRSENALKTIEPNILSLIMMGLLGLSILFIGLFPHLLFSLFIQPVSSFIKIESFIVPDSLVPDFTGITKTLSSLSFYSIIFCVILTTVFLIRLLFMIGTKRARQKTWDCGHSEDNSRIQYTSDSFSRSFVLLFKPFLPLGTASAANNRNGLESNILNLFNSLQNGNVQQYILYALLFLGLAVAILFGISL